MTMNARGDTRFLSWGLFLEPSSTSDRLRYLLFFDTAGHKLMLIECHTQQPSSYAFSCVSESERSDDDDGRVLILGLDNSTQSYTVSFYFDSAYDRDCCHELLLCILKHTIDAVAPKYGTVADLEIGCQVQHNKHDDKLDSTQSQSEWEPRILSVVHNRILLSVKARDEHPLDMLSLSSPHFAYDKTDAYQHTICLSCTNGNGTYLVHVGDEEALRLLNETVNAALSRFNKEALTNSFHPHKHKASSKSIPDTKAKAKAKKVALLSKSKRLSAKTQLTEFTEPNEQQSQDAVLKAHDFMASDTDDDDDETESGSSETETESGSDADDDDAKSPMPQPRTKSKSKSKSKSNAPQVVEVVAVVQSDSETEVETVRPLAVPVEITGKVDEESSDFAITRSHGCHAYTRTDVTDVSVFSNQTECKQQHPQDSDPLSDAEHDTVDTDSKALDPMTIAKQTVQHNVTVSPKRLKQSVQPGLDADGNQIRVQQVSVPHPPPVGIVRNQSRNVSVNFDSPASGRKSSKLLLDRVKHLKHYRDASLDNSPEMEQPPQKQSPTVQKAFVYSRRAKGTRRFKAHDTKSKGKVAIKHRYRDIKRSSKSKVPTKVTTESVPTAPVEDNPFSPRPTRIRRTKKAMTKRQSAVVTGNVASIQNARAKTTPKRASLAERPTRIHIKNIDDLCHKRLLPISPDPGFDSEQHEPCSDRQLRAKHTKGKGQRRALYMQKASTLSSSPCIDDDTVDMLTRSKSLQYNPNGHTMKPQYGRYQSAYTYKASEESKALKLKQRYSSSKPSKRVSSSKSTKRLRAAKWDSPLRRDREQTSTFIWGRANPAALFPTFAYPMTPWLCDNLSKKQIHSVSVAKEGAHCLGIGANDWCFVWGAANNAHVLGMGMGSNAQSTSTTSTTPFLLRTLRKERVKQTACSARHSLCITDTQCIYGWGDAQLTLLGADTNEPTQLHFLNGKGIKSLSACNTHSLAWSNRSIHVYAFGIAGPWLGFDDANAQRSRHSAPATFGIVKFEHFLYTKDITVSTADCSSGYSLIALSTGLMGAFGLNEHGRMGVGAQIGESSKVVWSEHISQIVRVSAGQFHAGFVDAHGRVFTVGAGSDYRLGHGELDTLFCPKQVEGVRRVRVREIECVGRRTYVISTAGHLLLWGKEPVTNRVHQTPFMYSHLSEYRVFRVSAAAEFCVVNAMRAEHPLETPDIDALNGSADIDVHAHSAQRPQPNVTRDDAYYRNVCGHPKSVGVRALLPQPPMAYAAVPNEYQNPNSHSFRRDQQRNVHHSTRRIARGFDHFDGAAEEIRGHSYRDEAIDEEMRRASSAVIASGDEHSKQSMQSTRLMLQRAETSGYRYKSRKNKSIEASRTALANGYHARPSKREKTSKRRKAKLVMCSHSGCGCQKFSKTSRAPGRCRTCGHKQQEHNKIYYAPATKSKRREVETVTRKRHYDQYERQQHLYHYAQTQQQQHRY